jgi:hypothetical protein
MSELHAKHVRRWTSYCVEFVLLVGCFLLKGCGIFPARNDYLSLEPPIAISKKGESAVAEYDLPEKRDYIFVIRFRAAINGVDNHRLIQLLGSPATNIYTKESVENGHPEAPPRYSSDPTINERNIWEGVRSGKYVELLADTSGQIPVRIVVSSLEKDGSVQSVFVDKEVNTNASFSSGRCRSGRENLCVDREIMTSLLPPGRYRVQVTTLDDIPRFDGVDARIAITLPHK